jgi:hypothetical protein
VKVPLLLLLLAVLAGSTLVGAEISKGELAQEDQIKRTLNQIVIPKVDFHETTLEDALKIAADEIRRRDPHGRGVPILLDIHPFFGPPAPPAGVPMSLADGDPSYAPSQFKLNASLKDIPALELLRFITGGCNTKFRVRSDGIHVVEGEYFGPMLTRKLRIPADFFPAFEREDRLCHTGRVAEMKADFAAYLFRPSTLIPGGSTVMLNSDATLLTVFSTEEKIAAIQKILETDRPASAFPVPGPKIPKVIEGPPREGVSDWLEAETDTARKLRTIHLPSLVLNTSLSEAGALLSEMSKRYDTEKPPSKRGVVIRTQIPMGSPRNPFYIYYSARHISLLDAVQNIAIEKQCSVDMDEYGVQWIPFGGMDSCWTRTYLVPPSTAVQLAGLWSEFSIGDNTPVSWLKQCGVTSLPTGNATYIAKRHHLVVRASVGQHKIIEKANDAAWREYYASQEAKPHQQR